jgi:hypothetical protein
MFNFLNTLRIHQSPEGIALVVGPKRRVVFGRGILLLGGGKKGIKTVLRPLEGYWSKPTDSDDVPGRPEQRDVAQMGFSEFRQKARRLLADSGHLVPSLKED